jgi:hypothetical protein
MRWTERYSLDMNERLALHGILQLDGNVLTALWNVIAASVTLSRKEKTREQVGGSVSAQMRFACV